METLILIDKPHSVIDLITNSSSEIFVCNTDKSLKMVKTILKEKYQEFLDNEVSEDAISFNEAFGKIEVLKGKKLEEFIDSVVLGYGYNGGDTTFSFKKHGISDPPSWHHILEEFRKDEYQIRLPYEENQEYNSTVHDKRAAYERKVRNDWKEKYADKARKIFEGVIIIPSRNDNTIPYEFFDIINDLFNGDSIHLG